MSVLQDFHFWLVCLHPARGGYFI